MKKFLRHLILKSTRKHITYFNTGYSHEFVDGFTDFLISDLHVRCLIGGEEIFCSVEESPHYKLIVGLEEDKKELINEYIQYQINIDKTFNWSAKIDEIKSLIKYKKQGSQFVILVYLHIEAKLRGKLVIFDGNHRAAILKYIGEDRIFAAYKL